MCVGVPMVVMAAEPGIAVCEPLNAASLARETYESGRPSAAEACRVGDARVLVRTLVPPTD